MVKSEYKGQECIPVGCVPSAAVVSALGGGSALGGVCLGRVCPGGGGVFPRGRVSAQGVSAWDCLLSDNSTKHFFMVAF